MLQGDVSVRGGGHGSLYSDHDFACRETQQNKHREPEAAEGGKETLLVGNLLSGCDLSCRGSLRVLHMDQKRWERGGERSEGGGHGAAAVYGLIAVHRGSGAWGPEAAASAAGGGVRSRAAVLGAGQLYLLYGEQQKRQKTAVHHDLFDHGRLSGHVSRHRRQNHFGERSGE